MGSAPGGRSATGMQMPVPGHADRVLRKNFSAASDSLFSDILLAGDLKFNDGDSPGARDH